MTGRPAAWLAATLALVAGCDDGGRIVLRPDAAVGDLDDAAADGAPAPDAALPDVAPPDVPEPPDAGPHARPFDAAPPPSDAAPSLDAAPALDAAPPPACDAVAGPAVPGGELVRNAWRAFDLPPCAAVSHVAVAAAGQRLTVRLRGLPAGATVRAFDRRGPELARAESVRGEAAVEIEAPYSGAIRVRVRAGDGVRGSRQYVGRLECTAGCDLEATQYPIVLVHGAAGTDRYFGVLDYFHGVGPALRDAGYAVEFPALTPIGPSEVRAADLAAFLDDLLAETGAEKVHLVGHSQAGIDIRILLGGHGYGDRVASATTIASPHRGLRLTVLEAGGLIGMRFDEDYMLGDFLERYPEDPSVPRFSWAGATCPVLDGECRARLDGEIVSPLLVAPYRLLRLRYRDDPFGGANDGLVPVWTARWGEFLGILPADHLDEIGQLVDRREGPFDHVAFYLSEARRLRRLELERGP